MRKRKWYLAFFLIALMALAASVLYEASTHVVRGLLRGEAFYDGRPTSFWRVRCDDWLRQFRTAEDAVLTMPRGAIADDPIGDPRSKSIEVISPPATVWSTIRDSLRSKEAINFDSQMPDVLQGLSDTVPVLRQLATEDRFKRVAERALWVNTKYFEQGFVK